MHIRATAACYIKFQLQFITTQKRHFGCIVENWFFDSNRSILAQTGLNSPDKENWLGI